MFCNKTEYGYFVCPNGHYVCDSSHSAEALDIIERFCLQSDSRNPMEMALIIMRHPGIPMHGSEHHGMIAAVLVAARYQPVIAGYSVPMPPLFPQA